jgi:hypothetical protein
MKILPIKSDVYGDARVAQSGGTISGNVTVERFMPARRAWRFLAVPFGSSSQSIRDAWQEGANNYGLGSNFSLDLHPGYGTHITGNNFSDRGFDYNITTTPSLQVWDSVANTWSKTEPATISTPITAYSGYSLFVRGSRAIDLAQGTDAVADNTTLRIKGILNETAGATISKDYPGTTGGYVMVGNPFASAINLKKILDGTNGSSGFELNKLWVWDPTLGGAFGVGAYVTYSNGVWAPTTGRYPGNSGNQPIIQSGQAFLVHLTGNKASINFQQGDKTASGSNVNGLQQVSANTVSESRVNGSAAANAYPVFYANLMSVSGSDLSLTDGVAAVFSNTLAKTADIKNAVKIANKEENMSFVSNNEKFTIEFRPEITSTDTLFFSLDLKPDRPYALQLFTQNVSDTSDKAWLVDKYLEKNIAVNLLGTSVYNFVPNSDVKSYQDRFMVVFKHSNATQKKTNTRATEGKLKLYPNPVSVNKVQLQFSGMEKGSYEITLYNSIGIKLASRKVQHNGGNSTYPLPLGAFVDRRFI